MNVSILLLLIIYIHTITTWLDEKLDWRRIPVERSLVQFGLGIVIPVIILLLLISKYAQTLDQNIIENGFLLIEFPFLLSFFIFLNGSYLFSYLVLTEPSSVINFDNHYNLHSKSIGTSTLTIQYKGNDLEFDISHDILYFYRFRKQVKFIAFNGEEYPVKKTLGAVTDQLKDYNFLQINRSVVLNFSMVEGYRPGLKRNTLELIFKNKYSHLLENQNMNQFVVTKEHILKITRFFNTF
ncbi:LytTR family DNA-binding domain-containing protein [Chryseobacterium lathyri]|uniref:HTH LytTR-type domain-containing protein n=1 Tax=Chryseobacterium lathyri TaxID=395933 RepID=A0A511Y7L0_9FLAO|nr:LytTR family DNA-binding domain-containing protein [Chryseobacterium lathyri]GEN71176.1 hypothetical protein CLA01_12480 [Chryseobacterium lathyri]